MQLEIQNNEYHARPYLSATSLKTFMLKSPAHYKAEQEEKRADSEAFRIGRMIHLAVLEPDVFAQDYALFEGDRRTKAGKEEYQAIIEQGKEIIKPDEQTHCEIIAQKARPHFSKKGKAELSFDAKIGDVHCQCRPDWLSKRPGKLQPYDLKTTADITKVDQAFYAYGYHIQDVFYRMILEIEFPDREILPTIFVFTEKTPPYDIAIRQIDKEIEEATKQKILDALESFKQCVSDDIWPGVEEPILKEAKAPSWLIYKLINNIELEDYYGG